MKREKTNAICSSSPTTGTIAQQQFIRHPLNISLLEDLVDNLHCIVYYLFADFTSPFNSTVNGRKVSQ